jgi:hypothetical protein
MNQGDDFETISEDLTTGGIKGDVAYSTLTSIHESAKRFGLIYTGSDDGLIHVTRDGGYSWKKISDNLPQRMWVSRVQASQHEESRVYATLNGYRWDDFNAYVYKSEDYGQTWKRMGLELPMEPVNVIKEDPKNENIIYIGTDHEVYISFNKGESFMLIGSELPAAPVHDLIIHPRDGDLIVGTHGRSIYVADIKPVQQLTTDKQNEEILVFDVESRRASGRWGSIRNQYTEAFESTFDIAVYSKTGGEAKFMIKTKEGKILLSKSVSLDRGIDYIEYDYSIDIKNKKELTSYLNSKIKKGDEPIKVKEADNDKVYLAKGKYLITVEKNGVVSEVELELK